MQLCSPAQTVTLDVMFASTSLSSVFRILMLGLLMAGVLVKPVIAFAGTLHEAEHAAVSGDDGHAADGSSDPIDPADATNPWHALMHFSHCCGQTPAVLPLLYLGAITPAATDPVLPWTVAFLPTAHPVALRPPISA